MDAEQVLAGQWFGAPLREVVHEAGDAHQVDEAALGLGVLGQAARERLDEVAHGEEARVLAAAVPESAFVVEEEGGHGITVPARRRAGKPSARSGVSRASSSKRTIMGDWAAPP